MRIFFTLILLLNTVSSFSKGELRQLVPLAQEMISLINKAKRCEVKERNGALVFCSGFELRKDDLRFLQKLDLKSCKNFLKQAGNRVIDALPDKRPKEVGAEVWHDFFSTTKLALIIHGKNIILFKNKAKRGDCLHETLHFYQRNRKSYSELSPLKRAEKKRRLQGELEAAIVVVENLEKAGKKAEAKKIADNLQPFINLQREWINIGQWLDEKEIYQAFLDFSSHFAIGKRDEDIALANLLRLKNSLSWQLRERVVHLANVALTEKYRAIPTPTAKTIGRFESERSYQNKFHKGTISRESYEANVIALRKFKADLLMKTSSGPLKKLEARSRKRDFTKAVETHPSEISTSFKLENGFIQVKVDGYWMVVDFGAQKTVLPKAFSNKLKLKDLRLLAAQILKTTSGQSKSSPYIQISKDVSFGKHRISGLKGTMADLGIAGVDGILGMDFFRSFNHGRWTIDFKKKTLSLMSSLTKGQERKATKLIGNGLGEFDSLEYFCRFKPLVKVRIDSGSQVTGDVNSLSQKKVSKCFHSQNKFEVVSPNSLLFSRDVDINLGLPYLLKNLRGLSFDLNKGLLILNERKK